MATLSLIRIVMPQRNQQQVRAVIRQRVSVEEMQIVVQQEQRVHTVLDLVEEMLLGVVEVVEVQIQVVVLRMLRV
jgi:hypothetical protein